MRGHSARSFDVARGDLPTWWGPPDRTRGWRVIAAGVAHLLRGPARAREVSALKERRSTVTHDPLRGRCQRAGS